MQHEKFTLKNPNRLRSVVSSFASCQNKFHAKDGSGYKFMGDMVLEVDQLNPQVREGKREGGRREGAGRRQRGAEVGGTTSSWVTWCLRRNSSTRM